MKTDLRYHALRDKEKTDPKPIWHDYSKRELDMLSLIDGCYEVIELYKPQSPSSQVWKENWLRKARKLGATPE
jgi:hypothetical protein